MTAKGLSKIKMLRQASSQTPAGISCIYKKQPLQFPGWKDFKTGNGIGCKIVLNLTKIKPFGM